MKFCQAHWDRLKKSIIDAGMGKLIADDGAQAVERMKAELDSTATDETFDPLMAAHNALVTEFLNPLGADGLYIFTGDYCPMCELVRLNPRPPEQAMDENWIKGVTRELQEYCREKKLIYAE